MDFVRKDVSEMDDILKAYDTRKYSDEVSEIIGFDPELGFNPYFWISRRLYEKMVIEPSQNPKIQAAYNRYRELHDAVYQNWMERYTEDFMKGQAFGL